MKPGLPSSLLLAAALGLAPAVAATSSTLALNLDSAQALALKRVADRYALTKVHIDALLEQRMNPTPLPANLPNPFYRAPDGPVAEGPQGGTLENPGETAAPPDADASDAGTLAKFVANLKVSGLTIFAGLPHLTLNSTLCKEGDVIPIEVKGHTVYILVKSITSDELVLKLNEDQQVIRLRR